MWLLQLGQSFLGLELGQFGILPRSWQGLWHIPLAPFVHHGWFHLISNSIPFLILGYLVELKGKVEFWETLFLIALFSGLGVLIFGSNAYHAGASGVVLGFWSFLLMSGYLHRTAKSILLAVIALIIYGGFFFALLDVRQHISWSSHAFGLMSGILVAWLVHIGHSSKKA